MSFNNLYRSLPVPVAYEGEGTGDKPPVTPTPPQPTPPADPPIDGPEVTFTQDDVNKFLAEDRRKHTEKLKEVEAKLEMVSQTAQLTSDEKAQLEESRKQLQKQLMTKEQIAAQEKLDLEKSYQEQLEVTSQERDAIKQKYEDSVIRRSLSDAAALNDAFNSEHVVNLLRDNTKLVDDKPMVDFPDVHVETGESIVTQLTPEAAVKRMKEMPERHGNLFKTYVVSGVGGSATTDDALPSGGKLDISTMSPQQYRKLRNENPEALGL